jgi:hypothetical protein
VERHAPAVRLAVREDRPWRLARRACGGVVVTGTVAWALAQGAATAWSGPAVALLALLLAVSVARRSGAAGHGELRWDGATWHFDDRPCDLHVALDLGAWLLLSATPAGGRRQWLALSRSDHPAAWHGLRCALYCPRPPPLKMTAGPGAETTPDER